MSSGRGIFCSLPAERTDSGAFWSGSETLHEQKNIFKTPYCGKYPSGPQRRLAGFGAIMPGISGGTLCVAFGMYQPLIEVFSHPRQALQKHWLSLCVFLFGAGIGFIGLSGLAGWLLEQNSQAVTCAFIGLIVGTIPELWRDAGQKGRRPSAYFAMVAGFTLMLSLLLLFRQIDAVSLRPDFWGFLFCGVMWASASLFRTELFHPAPVFRIVSTHARRNLPPVPGRSAASGGRRRSVPFNPVARRSCGIPQVVCRNLPRHDRHCRRNCNHDFTGAQRERCKIALNWVCLAAGAVVSYAAGRACLKLSQR